MKKFIIYDESYYNSSQGEVDARDVLMNDYDIDHPTDSQVFDEAMLQKEECLEREIEDLKRFFDFSESSRNKNCGNTILVKGYSSRWNSRTAGINIYSDIEAALDTESSRYGRNNIYADCEFEKIWEEDGALFILGSHHDGEVLTEFRQLSKKGEVLFLESLNSEGDVDLYGLELKTMNTSYREGDESRFIHDLWNNPDLCPKLNYIAQLRQSV